MLPILYKFQFNTVTMQVVGIVLGLALVAYGYWSGWRGAEKSEHAVWRGLPFACGAALAVLVAAIYMAPPFGPTGAGVVKALVWGFAVALTATAALYARKVGESPFWYGGIGAGVSFLAIKFGLWDGAIGRNTGAPLHTYGLMMACAFAMAFWLTAREAPRAYPETVRIDGKNEPLGPIMRDRILDLGFYVIIGGLVGSRLLFVITKWEDYQRNLKAIFSLEGGLVFYGGFIGAALVVVYYCRAYKLEFLRLADVIIPSVALAHAIGRLGCLAAGCCWGGVAKAGSWLAVRFPSAARLGAFNFGTDSMAYAEQARDDRWFDALGHLHKASAAGLQHVKEVVVSSGYSLPVYPTQLMESIGELSLFLVLLVVRRSKRFNGQVFATWLILYAIVRFSIELFRGDDIRGRIFSFPSENPVILTTSQGIAVALFAAGVAVWAIYGRRARAAATATTTRPSPG